jgi:single-strand DNA-binding protein
MANDLNRCEFIGRAGRDPEIRYTQAGKAVANWSIAVGWKSANGEGVTWVSCAAFDRLAEIVGEYVRKGSQMYIAGKFDLQKYTDKEGAERTATKIVVQQLQLLSRSDEGAREPPQERAQPRRKPTPQPTVMEAFDDDEIPF